MTDYSKTLRLLALLFPTEANGTAISGGAGAHKTLIAYPTFQHDWPRRLTKCAQERSLTGQRWTNIPPCECYYLHLAKCSCVEVTTKTSSQLLHRRPPTKRSTEILRQRHSITLFSVKATKSKSFQGPEKRYQPNQRADF